MRDHPSRVADDADNFVGPRLRSLRLNTQMAADGVFPGKSIVFAVDSLMMTTSRAIEALVIAEVAAAHQRDLERGEVAGIDATMHEIDSLPFRERRMFDDGDETVASPAFAGQRTGKACGLNAGERSHSGEELLEEGDSSAWALCSARREDRHAKVRTLSMVQPRSRVRSC